MSFSMIDALRRMFAPQHELSCSWSLWRRLLQGLRERGRNRSRESGAFLLGRQRGVRARIVDFVLYDDLDHRCLSSGIICFDGGNFGKLWAICRNRNLAVVADIHVHPGGAQQSQSDRDHPMIARKGHCSLILPNFAAGRISRREIGIYRYLGGKRWRAVPRSQRKSFFHIGF